VVNIASARHMTTTAEGVETQAQLDMLRKLGCTEMQGYLFSPARPAADVMQLLQSRRDNKVAAA
jgi:EAL domain-containing protein (putative c-di-GMP-specific phosphodiesterase class I)